LVLHRFVEDCDAWLFNLLSLLRSRRALFSGTEQAPLNPDMLAGPAAFRKTIETVTVLCSFSFISVNSKQRQNL